MAIIRFTSFNSKTGYLYSELLKPADLPPWAVFKAVLADVALRQLSYVAPRQLRGR